MAELSITPKPVEKPMAPLWPVAAFPQGRVAPGCGQFDPPLLAKIRLFSSTAIRADAHSAAPMGAAARSAAVNLSLGHLPT